MQICETCYLHRVAAPAMMVMAVVFAIVTLLTFNGWSFIAAVLVFIVGAITWFWTLPKPPMGSDYEKV